MVVEEGADALRQKFFEFLQRMEQEQSEEFRIWRQRQYSMVNEYIEALTALAGCLSRGPKVDTVVWIPLRKSATRQVEELEALIVLARPHPKFQEFRAALEEERSIAQDQLRDIQLAEDHDWLRRWVLWRLLARVSQETTAKQLFKPLQITSDINDIVSMVVAFEGTMNNLLRHGLPAYFREVGAPASGIRRLVNDLAVLEGLLDNIGRISDGLCRA